MNERVAVALNAGISLYLQGTHLNLFHRGLIRRYIPVPTGNSPDDTDHACETSVYPCTYRELPDIERLTYPASRYIPVPTGNSHLRKKPKVLKTVYPCTYRELNYVRQNVDEIIGISLYLQGTLALRLSLGSFQRYIPVPTGNSGSKRINEIRFSVYPCTYRELCQRYLTLFLRRGISLYLQGTPTEAEKNLLEQRYIPVPTGNSTL